MATAFSRTTRSLASSNPKSSWLAWIIAGLFLGAWCVWFFVAEITVYEVSNKARLEVERSAHPVEALTAGKISTISVSLDQAVQAGQVLAELDASSEKFRLQEEESRLQALPPQIEALQREIAAREQARSEDHKAALSAVTTAHAHHKEAAAAAEFAKDHERRLNELTGSGRIAVIESLRAHAESQKMQASADAFASEINRLEMDAKTREHDNLAEIENLKRSVVTLEGQIQVTRAAIARLKQEIEKHLIRAPITGQIGDVVPLQVGSYLAEGDRLAMLVPSGKLRIVADFPPAAVLGRIHPGQASRMRLDGFPWAQYGSIPAEVSHVASEVRDNLVRVEFTPNALSTPKLLMQHGLPGAIEVSIERVAPAVMVLRSVGQWIAKPVEAAPHNGL